MPFLRVSPLIIAASLALTGQAAAQHHTSADAAYEFQSVVPLGVETFKLEAPAETVNLVASAESPFFEGIRIFGHGPDRVVQGADGSPVSRFPEQITFRITATAKGKSLGDKPIPISKSTDLNQYLLGLRFRLKIFRGLDFREVKPSRVELVGVPADVAYDERIYRLVFQIGEVLVDERILLEVFDASGERLTRFHLELM